MRLRRVDALLLAIMLPVGAAARRILPRLR